MVNKRKETEGETIKRLSDPNYEGGNYALPERASELEKSKYEICQNIARYKRINELSLKDLAYELGISPSKLDNVLYCRINLLKLDDLASYLEKLQIDFHLKITKEVREKRLEV
jgi:molybdenum cofactor biosynthesis enzyme MoaA